MMVWDKKMVGRAGKGVQSDRAVIQKSLTLAQKSKGYHTEPSVEHKGKRGNVIVSLVIHVLINNFHY